MRAADFGDSPPARRDQGETMQRALRAQANRHELLTVIRRLQHDTGWTSFGWKGGTVVSLREPSL